MFLEASGRSLKLHTSVLFFLGNGTKGNYTASCFTRTRGKKDVTFFLDGFSNFPTSRETRGKTERRIIPQLNVALVSSALCSICQLYFGHSSFRVFSSRQIRRFHKSPISRYRTSDLRVVCRDAGIVIPQKRTFPVKFSPSDNREFNNRVKSCNNLRARFRIFRVLRRDDRVPGNNKMEQLTKYFDIEQPGTLY